MFSTTIILFVTVSLSDSKSLFVIRLSIFVNPARSVSDSPDILAKRKHWGGFVHASPARNLSVRKQAIIGTEFVQNTGCYVTLMRSLYLGGQTT